MNKKKLGLLLVLCMTLLLCGIFGYFLWHRYHYAVSNAVFVQADRVVYLSFSKVSGRIIKLYKSEGEKVKEGEVLAIIAKEDYLSKVNQLKESLNRVISEREALEITKNKIEREIELKIQQVSKQLQALKERRQARIFQHESLQARLDLVRKDRVRLENLFKDGLISRRDLEVKETEERELINQGEGIKAEIKALDEEIKALEGNLNLLQNERKTLQSLSYQIKALNYQEREIKQRKDEANFYLEETILKSSLSGIVAKKFHAEGDVIAPGEPLYAVVDPESFYILVLLEETKLRGVAKGAKARIRLDAFPDKHFEGEVEEVLPASAATFALVPRDISAGEFTKLAQRIPVRIKILRGDRSLLRVGLSGEVEIKRLR
ncbi:MAG: HlyD family secretion protein [Caldimicrobium sp.]|nr:HlyD family secretion protein [Caldimicrobium sp.]MCX7874486.1 HlyD family secretion protein [Caldimicrobium sp.]MDW8094558.1 HlyD family secretion protein [Caldimicrobium sp.]